MVIGECIFLQMVNCLGSWRMSMKIVFVVARGTGKIRCSFLNFVVGCLNKKVINIHEHTYNHILSILDGRKVMYNLNILRRIDMGVPKQTRSCIDMVHQFTLVVCLFLAVMRPRYAAEASK